MDPFKTILWSIIAVFFAAFSIYSYTMSRSFKNLEEEVIKPRFVRTSGGDIVFGADYGDILKSFYNIINSSFIIGGLGFLVSAIAAIISAFI
ncbi:MAG: hypothetical protein ACXVHY_04075 [Methanobacterium sp.]